MTAFLATKIQAKKKATWLHDEKPYWMKSVQKYLCEYDKIYGVSQAVVDAFCREYPHYKDKAAVFYNVIDIEEIKRKSEQDEIIPFKESFNIVTVGRLTEQKGYDIAIKAASILKKRKINFAWYAIGGGRDEKKLKKLVEKYCLENQFVFLGRKKNPYPYMKHCDLYVQPSRHEGYVITLVEARALCLPILSSDIPSAREQIQDGINGYVAELSAEDLADKIEYLYNNPSQFLSKMTNLRGAYAYYATANMDNSFFDNGWKIAFGQLLLLTIFLIFQRSVNKCVSNYTELNRQRYQYVYLMCVYDFLMIPVNFILGIWRGYEYFYIPRLILWGIVLKSISYHLTLGSRKILRIVSLTLFIIWMIFRVYNTYEDSLLMPYILDIF